MERFLDLTALRGSCGHVAHMAQKVDLHVGRRLRRRRQLLGMTQVQLAAACGLTFQQIHKYESATNGLSAARLWCIAQALSVPIAYFFDGLVSDLPVGHSGLEEVVHANRQRSGNRP